MASTLLAWMAAGVLGGALAGGVLREMAHIVLGDSLLGMLAGLLGGAIVALFDGIATPRVALASVAVAFLAGMLQILILRLLNDGRQLARW